MTVVVIKSVDERNVQKGDDAPASKRVSDHAEYCRGTRNLMESQGRFIDGVYVPMTAVPADGVGDRRQCSVDPGESLG